MWGSIAIAFLLAFVTSCAITPVTIKLAKKVGAVDIPKDERVNAYKDFAARLFGERIYPKNLITLERAYEIALRNKKEVTRRQKYKCLSTGKIVDECVTGLLKEDWIK